MYTISTLLFLVAGKASRVLVDRWITSETKCKSPLHGPRNYVDRTWELSANYSARTFPAIGPNQKSLSNFCMEALSHCPEMKKEDVLHGILPKNTIPTCHTPRVYSPPKVLLRPLSQIYFANSKTIFHFRFFSKKPNPHSLQKSS